jgi:hypothetical protein
VRGSAGRPNPVRTSTSAAKPPAASAVSPSAAGPNAVRTPTSAATPAASVVSASAVSPGLLTRHSSSWSSVFVIGGALVTALVVSGVAFLAAKSRRPRRVCRVCGTSVPHSASLCQTCRHVAAEALRRAAAERATGPAPDEEQRQKQAHEEQQRQLEAREDEREQLRKQEEARLLALEEAARRRKEETRRLQAEEEDGRRSQVNVASGLGKEAFDPFTVLGVSRDTSPQAIRSAYQEAKLKYDMDQVAHLSNEVQQLFKAKIQAVERAYQMLEERR